MKYISLLQLNDSISRISSVNQFFGFTYLALKKADLPVGKTKEISVDATTKKFLSEYYKIDPRSDYYFRIFRYNNTEHMWLKPDYPGSGLQKLNTSTFKEAFIHEHKTKNWGWSENYVEFLETKLTNGQKVPAFDIAVWLFRNKAFDQDVTKSEIVDTFFSEFKITLEEREKLFSEAITSEILNVDGFQDTPVSWREIVEGIDPADDVKPSTGGILSLLSMDGIGPVKSLKIEPSNRLNIITGDNGLGKTFILETAWWALTGVWAGQEAYPDRKFKSPKISFNISGKYGGNVQTIKYSQENNEWSKPLKRSTISGLVVYGRVDGSFAIWDPAGSEKSSENKIAVFNKEQVWNGNNRNIEGLVRDWTKWQDKPEKYPFEIFERVVEKMSPPEMQTLKTGQPVRIWGDPREIPTLVHSYGDVPILHESAGVKRIITLAYLIVWVWNEHKILSEQYGKKLEKRMVIMVDELEAHLHPKWQRAILPALLDVAKILSSDLELQLIIATHSPLVLASAESIFDTNSDKLFHLETRDKGQISFEEIPFIKYGHINSWLESEVFGLKEARSNEASDIVKYAISLQKMRNVSKSEIERTTELLLNVLSTEDKFWNRWMFFAKKHGVSI
ncbi:AAA family ATPase [Flavobacterium silvaticum]|uniref:AAA family ATPase n=1 Tax=Flavobacterium silvaticum TaxID=1852020 RepID=A0A972FRA0_9FLAO|nr:AAA family ATPase [Flavobacterium silvaticum]NMH26542.1 AAA family ATPase [Flavobacterium silvaticum]